MMLFIGMVLGLLLGAWAEVTALGCAMRYQEHPEKNGVAFAALVCAVVGLAAAFVSGMFLAKAL